MNPSADANVRLAVVEEDEPWTGGRRCLSAAVARSSWVRGLVARVELGRDITGGPDFVDQPIGVLAADHLLELRRDVLVGGCDQEAVRVRAHLLVLRDRQLDDLDARVVAALADPLRAHP